MKEAKITAVVLLYFPYETLLERLLNAIEGKVTLGYVADNKA